MNERAVVYDCAGDPCLGIVHAPAGAASATGILVVVGGPQYRVGSHRQFVHLARDLAQHGYACFRFDYRGMGDSAGAQRDFCAISMDIRAAIDAFMQAVPGLRAVMVFGLCDAASAAMMYCSTDQRVAGLILANPWVRSEAGLARAHVKQYYGRRLLHGTFWRKLFSGQLHVTSSIRGFLRDVHSSLRGRQGQRSDPSATNYIDAMRSGLAEFRGPVLLLISGRDLTAAEFTDLCARDGAWASLVRRRGVEIQSMETADHTFSAIEAQSWANETARGWLATAAPAAVKL
jgi:exosortase A-associated hydrolase 1